MTSTERMLRDALQTAKQFMAHKDTCNYGPEWALPSTDFCTCAFRIAMLQVNDALTVTRAREEGDQQHGNTSTTPRV